MKYVIDASTAFSWEVPEPHSLKAIALREDYRNGVHELISPDIFPAEVGNALIVAERKGRTFRSLLLMAGCSRIWPFRLPCELKVATILKMISFSRRRVKRAAPAPARAQGATISGPRLGRPHPSP